MVRLVLGVLFTFTAISYLLCFHAEDASVDNSLPPFLVKRVETHARFLAEMDRSLRDLCSGERSVEDIVASLQDYAQVFYPCYLDSVMSMEQGRSDAARIANNLIRAIDSMPLEPGQRLEIIKRVKKASASFTS